MKILIFSVVSCLFFKVACCQVKEEKSSLTLTSDRYTQQINKDSVNKGETSFRYIDTQALNGTITEKSSKKDKQENSSTSISTALVIIPNKDNKE